METVAIVWSSVGSKKVYSVLCDQRYLYRRYHKLVEHQLTLTGTIPELACLSSLVTMGLDLVEAFRISPLCRSLTRLSPWDNSLTDAIPDLVGLPSLVCQVWFVKFGLVGPIPKSVERNHSGSRIIHCQVSHGCLAGTANSLTGTIPDMTGLSSLSSLSLARNQLSGSIQIPLSTLTVLVSMTLNENNLTGSLPTEFGPFSLMKTFTVRNNVDRENSGRIQFLVRRE